MKNVSNIIAWTSVDEQLHANAGIYIINQIKTEIPDIIDENTKSTIYQVVKDSLEIEGEILNWIFEEGNIENLDKTNLLNFMKFRVDESLEKIGLDKLYNIEDHEYQPMRWFEEEVLPIA